MCSVSRLRQFTFLTKLMLGAFLALILTGRAQSQSWTGSWDTRWRDGGAIVNLTQHDDGRVTGDYPLYGGQIEGEAHGRSLTGRWKEPTRSSGFSFVMSGDGQSFMGRFDSGEWWTGSKLTRSSSLTVLDQTGVRQALRTFVFAGNLSRAGMLDELRSAVAVLDFGDRGTALLPGQKLEVARKLFELIDLTTFHLWSFPGKRAPGETFEMKLGQAGTAAELPLSFRKKEEKWFILAPVDESVAFYQKTLLARFGGRPPAPDAYNNQKSARDTMTKFLSGFVDWEHGGEQKAIETLDTSEFVESSRAYEASLAAQYLKLTLDKISVITPQEIPNDPADRQPYVHFVHAAGRIVIAPVGQGENTVWKFSPETVNSARSLYEAIEDMPAAGEGLLPAPQSGFFMLRSKIRAISPSLLQPIGPMERWQLGLGALGLALCFLIAWGFSHSALRVLRWDIGGEKLTSERRMIWPSRLLVAAILFKLLIPYLGWPEEVRRLTVPLHALIIGILGVWTGLYLITALSHNIAGRFERTGAAMDEILLSLVLTAVRILLVAGAAIYVADAFSIPYSGLLAGLGIGGLAFAFASKETLANVFGAAILVADRPFRKGDWISTSDLEGVVEDVGIRSTRVRTVQDTLVVVPNGKLTDTTITNWGYRRHRYFQFKFFVPFGKSASALDLFISDLKATVRTAAKVETASVQAGIRALGENGIEIGLSAYLNVSSLDEELDAKHRLMMAVIALAQKEGVMLGAMPSEMQPQHTPATEPPPPSPASVTSPPHTAIGRKAKQQTGRR